MHAKSVLPALLLALAAAGCQARAPQPAPQPAAQREDARASFETRSAAGPVHVRVLASGLEHPWALAVLPEGGFLVTERPGRLRRVDAQGRLSAPIAGVPAVWAQGQGGLLDVALAPDYARSGAIYLSYAAPGPDGTAATAVARGVLRGGRLGDVRRIYLQQPWLSGPNHFGSRLAFDRAGHLFISQGERYQRALAQRLDVLQGKLVRLDANGGVPADNPFVGRRGSRPEIWSLGHRNVQSLAVDPATGTLWEAEHGPRGGDEINLPRAGANYGWPLATHGIDYSGAPIAEARGTTAPGTEAPYHVWPVSPALSGMAFLRGHPELAWNDSLFLGALADGTLIRLGLSGNRISGEERLLRELGARIRDVRVGPDGAVYVLTDEADGRLLRLEPPRRASGHTPEARTGP